MDKFLIRKAINSPASRRGDAAGDMVTREYDPDTAWMECIHLIGEISGRLTAQDEKMTALLNEQNRKIVELTTQVTALRDDQQQRIGAKKNLGDLRVWLLAALAIAGYCWQWIKGDGK